MERIDGQDFRGWMTRNGCAPEAVQSAYVKCWYDAIAAYEDGDIARPSIRRRSPRTRFPRDSHLSGELRVPDAARGRRRRDRALVERAA